MGCPFEIDIDSSCCEVHARPFLTKTLRNRCDMTLQAVKFVRMDYIELAVWTRWCLFAAVLGTALSLASAELTAGGLAALPSSFQGDVTDRAAGLKSWGKLLGQAVIFNQVGTQQSQNGRIWLLMVRQNNGQEPAAGQRKFYSARIPSDILWNQHMHPSARRFSKDLSVNFVAPDISCQYQTSGSKIPHDPIMPQRSTKLCCKMCSNDILPMLLQAGDASRGAYSLESLIQKAQHQIILQAAGLAKNSEVASATGFAEEKAGCNPFPSINISHPDSAAPHMPRLP